MVITALPELGNNESLLLEVSDVKVKGTTFTLLLTNKRLILSEKGAKGEISSQMPLPVIVSADPGNSDSGEPVLNVSIKAPDGSDRRMMFVFQNNPEAGDRSFERDALLHAIERGELPPGADPRGVSSKRRSSDDSSSSPAMNSKFTSNSEPFQSFVSGRVFHQPPPPPPPPGYFPLNHNANMNPSSELEVERGSSYRAGVDPVRRPPSNNYPPARDSSRSYNGNMNPSSGFETGRSTSRRAYENPIRRSPSKDAFHQPPPPSPPPPDIINRRDYYRNMDSSCSFGPAKQSNPYSYDPFPNERVAPQYIRRFENYGGGGSGRQTSCEFRCAPRPGRKQRNAPKKNVFYSGSTVGEYYSTDSIPATILGMLRSPEETFRLLRTKEVEDAVPVLLVSLAVFAFGSTFFLGLIASSAGASDYPSLSGLADLGTLIFVAFEMMIFGVILAAITGILLHFVAYYEGFDEDISQSLKVAGYSAAPYAVGGVIPFFGIIIAPLWCVYLQYTGMRETCYMEPDQAVVAVLVPAAVFAVLFIIMTMLGGDNFSIFGGA